MKFSLSEQGQSIFQPAPFQQTNLNGLGAIIERVGALQSARQPFVEIVEYEGMFIQAITALNLSRLLPEEVRVTGILQRAIATGWIIGDHMQLMSP